MTAEQIELLREALADLLSEAFDTNVDEDGDVVTSIIELVEEVL